MSERADGLKAAPECGCKDDDLGYQGWHQDADKRYRKGQRQLFCTVCWRWPEFVGPGASTITKAQHDLRYRKPDQTGGDE